jgi:CheY-like chemotaxis protein
MNKYILLVEDNPDDEALSVRALRKNSVQNEVVIAHDGVEAVEFLFATGVHAGRDVHALPALMLLDLKLPRLDGVEVLRQIRQDPRTRHLPVVILTSSIEESDLVKCYRLGCNSYIRKPVDFNQFMDTVRQIGICWLILNETPPVGMEAE